MRGHHRRVPTFTQLNQILGGDALGFSTLVQESEEEKDEASIYRSNLADQVYTFQRWEHHRSPTRYARYLLHMFSSRVFRQLLPPVLAVMGLAVLVGLYESLLKAGALPGNFPHLSLALGQAWSLTGFALSLLLAFKTNMSYDRWWEARKLWGGVVTRCRDIVRQGLVYSRPEERAFRELLARWTTAFPRALMCHVREDGDVQKELQGVLLPDELRALLASAHRPNFVMAIMTEVLFRSQIDLPMRTRVDANISLLEDVVAACERILRTPIPLSYTRHTSRFLLVWLLMLPVTLWAAYRWAAVPLCGILGFLMLGIDEIGVQIEEPFGVLPLETICGTIERNIRELVITQGGVSSLLDGFAAAKGGPAAAAASVGEEFGELIGASPAEGGREPPTGLALLSRSATVEDKPGADAEWAHRHKVEVELSGGGDIVPVNWQPGGSRGSTVVAATWVRD